MDYQKILNKSKKATDKAFKDIETTNAQEVTPSRKLDQDAALRPSSALTAPLNALNQQMGEADDSSLSLRSAPHFDGTLDTAELQRIAFSDPMANALRHFEAPEVLSSVTEEAASPNATKGPHVRPNSIQSSQSPAAYLKYIYDLAIKHIGMPSDLNKFTLERRRPDLKNLVLSEDNLHQKISTLSLVNELLIAQLVGTNKPFSDEAALIKNMRSTAQHPFTLPFDGDHATVRESLAAMDGLSLNTITRRARPDNFALLQSDFSLVPNHLDALRLYGAHGDLLAKTGLTDKDLYGRLYGLEKPLEGNKELQNSKNFMTATGLSFATLRELLRDDVNVFDEDGQAHATAYIEFLAGGYELKLELKDTDDKKTNFIKARLPGPSAWGEVPKTVHELQNKAIRLQQRTGLPYHELDWLLRTAMRLHGLAGVPIDDHNAILKDGSALNVLAHFVEWRNRYNLTADEFAALLYEINYFHRAGTSEVSLMRRLFGDDAAKITRYVRETNRELITFDEIESDGLKGHVGAMLRRGLQLSLIEWKAIIKVLEIKKEAPLDGPVLGRIYRLATIFPMLGWSVLDGLTLLRAIDADVFDSSLLNELTNSVPNINLLYVMDRLSWLAGWMGETGLTVQQVIHVLTPPNRAPQRPTQDILNWVAEVKTAVQNSYLMSTDLLPYQDWASVPSLSLHPLPFNIKTIRPKDWVEMLSREHAVLGGTSVKQITSLTGLILPVTRAEIETAVRYVLVHYKVLNEATQPEGYNSTSKVHDVAVDVLEQGYPEQRIATLVDLLVSKQEQQADIVASEIVQLGEQLTDEAVPALLVWMGQDVYSIVQILDGWDTEKQPDNEQGLCLYFDLSRHIAVAEALTLKAVDLVLLAAQPNWLAGNVRAELSLKQIYLVSRFKALQSTNSSADAWLLYFAKVNEQNEADQTENYEFLSLLLDWPAADIALLASTDVLAIKGGCIATVEQADFLARRIDLCRDMETDAQTLIALENAAWMPTDLKDSEKVAIWAAAAVAAQAGVHNFQQGVGEVAAKGAVDEEARDALAALYLSKVAAKDSALKDAIKTDENLYEYLLLDVKVSYLVPTTRLLAATGAVQLYINRVIENIEDKAKVSNPPKLLNSWEISRRYRLWEANEKLKLFPSNYIEPELRQSKTELFEDFEMALGQGNLDEDTVEKAVHGYVNGLQSLSDMRPHGFFVYQKSSYSTTYYFTAKATGESHGYYLRHLDLKWNRIGGSDGRWALKWSPWSKLDVPIAAQQVYGTVPAYYWNRLFIFWLELEKRRSSDGKTTTYHLKPKYCRQNLDGSFSEPWEPELGVGVDMKLDIGNESFDPEKLDLKIYQPRINASQKQISLALQTTNLNQNRPYEWFTSQGKSIVDRRKCKMPDPIKLPGYNSTQSLSFSKGKDYFIEDEKNYLNKKEYNENVNLKIEKEKSSGSVTLKITGSHWTIQTNKEKDKVNFEWDCTNYSVEQTEGISLMSVRVHAYAGSIKKGLL